MDLLKLAFTRRSSNPEVETVYPFVVSINHFQILLLQIKNDLIISSILKFSRIVI